MSEHVFVRIVGYGATVLPVAPFHISRADDNGRRLVFRSLSAEQIFDFTANDLPASAAGVADITPSSDRRGWQLQTSLYSAPWPDGFALVSTDDPASPAGFDLFGPGGSVVYVQGPYARGRITSLSSLAAPGERALSSGTGPDLRWIRFAYEHAKQHWEHAYLVVSLTPATVVLVTAQSLESFAEQTFAAATQLAAEMHPGADAPDVA